MRVAIFGSSGMLGSMVLDVLAQDSDLRVSAIDRDYIDARTASIEEIRKSIHSVDWVVNCIGMIKSYIHDDNIDDIESAVLVNSLFPHRLERATNWLGVKVIQIATDCVYSGARGQYYESDSHDALDVYGKTKSLGEVYADNFYNLRCSIIGPEEKSHTSLMDWFIGQPENGRVDGFTNHIWNGITTLHFAKICQGIIKNDLALPHIQHIIPNNSISKSDLLETLGLEFNRQDIMVNPIKAPKAIDRTLLTDNPEINWQLWQMAGYDKPPTIEQMVHELGTRA